jgi:uncharacterized repeat protein (TIGR03803 family)
MHKTIKNLCLLPALVTGLGVTPTDRIVAQTFTTLHSFTPASFNSSGVITNSDGAHPSAGLTLSGNTLYGTAEEGGTSGYGTLFALNTDGEGFTNLHSFNSSPPSGNSDGVFPQAGLVLSGNILYGTTPGGGGSSGSGTVFAVNTDGTGFASLHSFTAVPEFPSPSTNSDGAQPSASLVLSSNTLYGTAYGGGFSGLGTVFAVRTDGTAFTNLYSFAAAPYPNYYHTNRDGAFPLGDLTLSGTILYGTAFDGGSSGYGAVFAVHTDGTGFTNLHSFPDFPYPDGANPSAGLVLSGNTLFGTALKGGSWGNGTIFAVRIDGTGFTNLHSFTYDERRPFAKLLLLGSTLYGTTFYGGSSDNGTVFAVNTDGTGFSNLHSFIYLTDGANPHGGLILSGNTLYGTTAHGGSSGYGTVFSLSLPPPQLTIIPSGTNVILTWPTYAPALTLQSTTNLSSPAAWSIVSPLPVLVNGQNMVTNALSGTQKLYRLRQ